MKKGLLLLSLVPCLLAIGPCAKETHWKSHSFKSMDLSRAPSEVRLPRELWEKIESLGGGGGKGAEKPAEADKSEGGTRNATATVFAPLKVFLIEKNPGILQEGHTEIAFGPGGGEIDFRDFVQNHNGSFYFVAEFMPEVENLTRHIYFVSNGLHRKIGKDFFGAGCNTYFDLSNAFDKALKGTGFLVNTTEGRHVSALAGNYFFAASHQGKLYLASLTIKDSGNRKYQCRR